MSKIKVKNVQQMVVASTPQPLKLGGVLEDGSDAVLTIENGGVNGLKKVFYATIPSASWTGASAPYSKVVTIVGIKASDRPEVNTIMSGIYATDSAMQDNLARIYRGVPTLDTITFYAHSVPSADIPIEVVVVR